MISCRLFSSDYEYWEILDVTSWFNKASDEDISDLFQEDLTGALAIKVAFCFREIDKIKNVFDYCHLSQSTARPIDVCCCVERHDAANWVRKNRGYLTSLIGLE